MGFKGFVDFTGEENEKEFLQKCLQQWEVTAGSDKPDVMKVIELATVFHEIRHRIEELE